MVAVEKKLLVGLVSQVHWNIHNQETVKTVVHGEVDKVSDQGRLLGRCNRISKEKDCTQRLPRND